MMITHFIVRCFSTLWRCHRLRIWACRNITRDTTITAYIHRWIRNQWATRLKCVWVFSLLCQSSEERWNLGNERQWMIWRCQHIITYYHNDHILFIHTHIYVFTLRAMPLHLFVRNLFCTCHLRSSGTIYCRSKISVPNFGPLMCEMYALSHYIHPTRTNSQQYFLIRCQCV